ncbi:MAG: SHOCT domain-containing protein, partial [Acidimicrobiia bacterium]
GQTLYTNIPKPEELQTVIYKAREERMMQLERGGQGVSKAEQLQILSRLHDEGKLSDEEFNVQKMKLLGSN